MTELNLNNIISKADFTPVQIGQSEQEVVAVLGEPVERHDTDMGATILFYGGYEFHFIDHELFGFHNDNLRNNKTDHTYWVRFQNDQCKINPGFVKPNQDVSLETVMTLLKKEKLTFSIEDQNRTSANNMKTLKLANGVALRFEKENESSAFILFAITYQK